MSRTTTRTGAGWLILAVLLLAQVTWAGAQDGGDRRPQPGHFDHPATPENGRVLATRLPPARPQESVVLDQQISALNDFGYPSHDFEPERDSLDTFIADDFTITDIWYITEISVPGDTWGTGCDLSCASALNWHIYADAGGVPAGDPWGGGSPPIWWLSLPPTDPKISLSTGTGGWQSNVALHLGSWALLGPGTWWLVFFPTLHSEGCGCDYGRQVSDSSNGYPAQSINPGGGREQPTTWTSIQLPSALGLAQHDTAFHLEGHLAPLLGDRVWYDTDRDGIQDTGEPGVKDVELVRMGEGDCNGAALASDRTDTQGNYFFIVPFSGTYCLQVGVLPAGWTISPRNQGVDHTLDSDADPATWQIRNIVMNGTRMDVDLGLYVKGSIGGQTWCDENEDHIYDRGEERARVTVHLYDDPDCDDDGDSHLASTDTDVDGMYLFDDLMVGPPGAPRCYAVTADRRDMGACFAPEGPTWHFPPLDAISAEQGGFNFEFRLPSQLLFVPLVRK